VLPRDEDILASLPAPPRTVAFRDLVRALEVSPGERPAFRAHLHALVDAGRMGRFRGNHYGGIDTGGRLIGTLIMTPRGFGFVALEKGGEDLYIAQTGLGTALHRDRVVVEVRENHRGRSEGAVIDVLDRGTVTFVGTYREAAKTRLVHPQDTRLPEHVMVERPGGAKDGDLVACEFSRYPDHPHGAAARIIRVFTADDETSQETERVVYDLGLRLRYPTEAENEANAFPAELPAEEVARRTDLRDRALLTIDPETARDFDDAVHAERRPDGGFRVTVAIADVSWYVRPGSPLDTEARARGFSVYLPDRVIPMLPHRLSSDLCSLRPDEDRLAMVVECTITPEGEIEDIRFLEAIFRSKARFTYDRVARMLGLNGQPPALDDDARMEALRPVLEALLDATRVRRRWRRRRGYLDMDLPEPKVFFGTDGKVSDIRPAPRHEAHQLVEDAMLVANEAAAQLFVDAHQPAIFRVHADPPAEGLARLRTQAGLLGVPVKGLGKPTADGLSRWLDAQAEHPLSHLLGLLTLRSMAKATYDEQAAPHFGLGSPAYLHFTSPIRRYADLVVHRLMKDMLAGRSGPGADQLSEVADQCARRERVSVDAERTVLDLYKALFLREHIGEAFQGTVVGATAMGLFVQLDGHLVEGFLPVEALDDDFYSLDEETFALVGRRKGRRVGLGTRLVVHIASVELGRRRVTLGVEA
jgi:ribonuclease R